MTNDNTTLPMRKECAVDEARPLRIVVIGAGVSGIALYIRLLQHVPGAAVTIVDKNPALGGTWWENRYPGVACDIPSHVYQYSFEPNPRWSKLFSPGDEILTYIKNTASKYKVDRKIKFNTKVVGANWSDKAGTWTLLTEFRGPSNEVVTGKLTADVVVSAVGILNNWKWPEIDGLHGFRGPLLHSANWDETWDYDGKTVALLGCGSSAIQILPELQSKCRHVTNFIRSGGTWVSQPFGSTLVESILSKSSESSNYEYSDEEKERFVSDQSYYQSYRRQMESFINKDFPCLFPGSTEEKSATEAICHNMSEKLMTKPGVYDILKPNFVPGCRRLTPGPGYLEALIQDNVELTKSAIVKVTDDGLVTQDGREHKVDAIVCATGFDCSYLPRFPIIGRDGRDLHSVWNHHASAYLSHSVPGFPNYFMVGGPNSATGGGSLLLILESIIGYIVKAVQKLSREHIKSMEVRQDALFSWVDYMDRYFPGTVHMDDCTSWYKLNGKITGLWPGSSLHAMKTLQNPRWEDYQYQYQDNQSQLQWLGTGWTLEDIARGDLGYYIDHADIPPIPSDEAISKQP